MTLHTEQEAREKWCPFSRAGYHVLPLTEDGKIIRPKDEAYLGNRDINGGNGPNTNCIGSQCMAWRWLDHISSRPTDSDTGYCGIARHPYPR